MRSKADISPISFVLTRFFDLLGSIALLVVFIPILLLIALYIALDSKGGVFFKQIRVGLLGKPFYIYKFRTMRPDSESLGQITVGGRDPRVTGVGYVLRKYKLDELPQLLNVLKGDMSMVGPRPEVPKYVDLYTEEEKQVLSVLPGITDYASIAYSNENEILAKQENPEQYYREVLMRDKLKINQLYIKRYGLVEYFKVIYLTLKKVLTY